MNNRNLFLHDPLATELLNNGVSKVAELAGDEQQLRTLRFELQTFVCDGEYARGLERILNAYLGDLGRGEQRAGWVSGFFGSGKSHLVKMLRYLWADYHFPDGASARSLARLPRNIADQFVELSNRARPLGGLAAAAGTLGAGTADNVRLAFIELLLRARQFPEKLGTARFLLWLESEQLRAKVEQHLATRNTDLAREIKRIYVSTVLADALVAADARFGSAKDAQAALRAQFPDATSPTIAETLALIRQLYAADGQLPCLLLVVDEVQQFIGDKMQRAHDVQEIAEHICTDLDSRVLLVATGQSALNTMPQLQKIQARFTIKVPLSDTDVENVIRQTVLAKKPECVEPIRIELDKNQGEISRHLQNTRLAARSTDDAVLVADYPLLPTRRRFWEKVLRNTDSSGTTAQLRTQLKIVFDAARETASRTLGTVVAADFIYDQVSSDLLNTGALQREYHEIILRQRDGTAEGKLRSSLCALIYLISRLPRETGADDGVRATAETLADLLVEDLARDSARLRQEIPPLLGELVKRGDLMTVETEYRLQTPESASWTHDFASRKTHLLSDETRLNTKREELLTNAVEAKLKSLILQQGASRETRKLGRHLSQARPAQSADEVTLWLRHGWAEDEKAVRADAQAAGTDSPMLFGYIPRDRHEDLREAIAANSAAIDTLNGHSHAATDQAVEARKSVETQRDVSAVNIQNALDYIVGRAKIFLGGGEEANGVELADKVEDAAKAALHRLFPSFADADDSRWPQVVAKARASDVGALGVLGYQGEVDRHPVCRAVRDFIGAGRKGREVREHFRGGPFGWPQDAIDGALYILTAAGNVRATVNGNATAVAALPQNQVGTAVFHVDVPPLNTSQRLALRGLFQKLDVTARNNEESPAAANFLQKLVALAETAGGEPPLPATPAADIRSIRELAASSGNAQLLAIHERKAELEAWIEAWKSTAAAIGKRRTAWDRLREFHRHAGALPEAAQVAGSVAALESQRGLLADPDPIPALTQKLTDALRAALTTWQTQLTAAFAAGHAQLAGSPLWPRLSVTQRRDLIALHQLEAPTPIAVATDDDILAALRASSLASRRDLLDAIPARFARALDEAARLLEPKAARVTLPAATLKTEAELDAWLTRARAVIAEKLKDGPVIL
ncbi:MAG: BREX system P-loop protein BrxC [Verrucomicrobiota bacterium]